MPGPEFTGGDRFELRRRLGEGSFGVVYEAFDRERGSRVALKTLKEPEATALYNLKREFRTLAGVSHPNLVNLYELLSVDEQWLITMELVQGQGFIRYVRGRDSAPSTDSTEATVALTPESLQPESAPTAKPELETGDAVLSTIDVRRLRTALRSLAEGLVALHSAGIIHRDIKPSNVLVDEGGHVTILDFGLVSDRTQNPEGTLLRIAGTPAYMSPEQARGAGVGEASDWFAVGIMLWEALVGKRPQRQTGGPEKIPPPSELVRDVPEDLDILCRALLQPNAHQRPSGVEILQRLGGPSRDVAPSSVARDADQRVPFIGRSEELEILDRAFEATESGEAALAFVHGSSGMGKTALIQHYLDRLRQTHQNAVVLRGRCYERESVPYKSVDSLIDALAIHLSRLPREEVEGLLPRDILALARLFPVLKRVEAVVEAKRRFVDISDSRELRRRAFRALRELLTRLADRDPTVLFIDDLQWGDTDSAALLLEVLRPPEPPAALLIGTYRTEEIETSPSLQAFLDVWSTQSSEMIFEVELGAFSTAEGRDLAFALRGGQDPAIAAQAERLMEEAGGNPFFLEKLLTSAATATEGLASAEGVDLDQMLRSTVEQVSGPGQQLLETLAVVGQPANVALVTEAADLQDSISLLPELEAERLVRVRETHHGEEIEIYHDRIRSAVLGVIPVERLEQRHRRLFETFRASGTADPETLAEHAEGCGEIEAAADYSARAAAEAAETLAFDRAARLYEKAIRLRGVDDEETRTMRLERARALVNAGRSAEAAEVYLTAVRGASREEALEIRRLAAQHYLMSGRYSEGLEAVRAVLSARGMALPKTTRKALLSLIFHRILLRFRGLDFKERDTADIPADLIERIDICWTVAVGLMLGNTIVALDFHARGLRLALEAGDPLRMARFLSIETIQHATGGSKTRKRTDQVVQAAAAVAKRADDAFALGLSTLYTGCCCALNGEWRRTVELARQAESIFREQCTGVPWEIDNAHVFEMFALSWLGEIEQMTVRLGDRLPDAIDRGDVFMATYLETDIAPRVLLAQDRPDAAWESARNGISRWPFPGYHRQHQYALRSRLDIRLYEGKGLAAWSTMEDDYEALKGSQLLRTQMNRIMTSDYRGRSALAAALETPGEDEREKLLRIAETEVRQLRKERSPWGGPLAARLAGSLAAARGDASTALVELAAAEAGFETTDMALHAAVSRMRRGQLMGGSDGARMVAEGEESLRRRGVTRPGNWMRMLSPTGA
jgi:serine/threonine protein kinase